MDFQSLDRLLTELAGLPIAQKIKDRQQLLTAWTITVGPAIAEQTRPIAINRDILQVATASAALAQDLTFKRRQILAKLNPQLTTPVRDIRFSVQKLPTENIGNGRSAAVSESEILWQEHPSRMEHPSEQIDRRTPAVDPQQAFQTWATRIQQRSQNWPICPQCHCPTPPGELKRWQVCGICATKQWHQ